MNVLRDEQMNIQEIIESLLAFFDSLF